MKIFNTMKVSCEQLLQDVMALPEEQRKRVFLLLATSLSVEVSPLAESMRRAEEMRSRKVTSMDESTFWNKMKHLRGTLPRVTGVTR